MAKVHIKTIKTVTDVVRGDVFLCTQNSGAYTKDSVLVVSSVEGLNRLEFVPIHGTWTRALSSLEWLNTEMSRGNLEYIGHVKTLGHHFK